MMDDDAKKNLLMIDNISFMLPKLCNCRTDDVTIRHLHSDVFEINLFPFILPIYKEHMLKNTLPQWRRVTVQLSRYYHWASNVNYYCYSSNIL